MSRLARIADRPRAALALCLVLSLVAVPGLFRLGFEDDLTRLFPNDFAEVQALATYRDAFGGSDTLLLLCRPPASATTLADRRRVLLAAGDALAEALARHLPPGATVHHRIDAATQGFLRETFQDHAFAYLAPDELAGAIARLEPTAARAAIQRNIARLEATADPAAEEQFVRDPLGIGADFFFPAFRRSAGALVDLSSGASLNTDATALLVRVEGTRPAHDVGYSKQVIAAAAAAVDDMQTALGAAGEPSDVSVSRAGGYLVAVVNERSIKGDMILTTVTSVLGVLLLFTLAFPPRWRGDAATRGSPLGRLVAPHLLVIVPLTLGVLWTAGTTGWAVGNITVITAGFIAVLVGLSVDFPIHLLARYRDATATAVPADAVRAALRGTGPGLVAAALTTAGGFLVLVGSRFRALAEMGVLTAIGLLWCLLAVFATASVLYPRVTLVTRVPMRDAVARLGGWSRRTAWGVITGAVVLTIVAAIGIVTRGLRFHEDLRALATPNPEARATQDGLADAFGLTLDPILLLTTAETVDAAADEAARVGEALLPLQRDGRIAFAFGPAALCPSRQRVADTAVALRAVDAAQVRETLTATLDAEGFVVTEFSATLDRLERAITGSQRGDLAPATLATHGDLWGRVARTVGAQGVAATMLQPARDVDRRELANAVAARAQSVGPGTQIAHIDRVVDRLHAELIPEMEVLAIIAAVVVALLTLTLLRHPGWAAAALVPVVCGIVWTMGVMAWCDWPLTFFNVCAGPLILGIGVDDGIHLVVRHREPDRPPLRSTLAHVGVPVLLTSITTMLGFGSLALATSPGLVSLGEVAAVGVAACLLASLGPLCAILTLTRRVGPPSPPPVS